MNSKEIAVYKHYKSLYGSMLLLFRVRNNYAICLCINESWSKFRSSKKVLETTATPIYGTFSF